MHSFFEFFFSFLHTLLMTHVFLFFFYVCIYIYFFFVYFFLSLKALWGSCWRHLQRLCLTGEKVEKAASWLQKKLEPCKLYPLIGTVSAYLSHSMDCWLVVSNLIQVVDARAGPGFKVTKPKKIKNGDGKKKSKLKKLHKFKRQSESF